MEGDEPNIFRCCECGTIGYNYKEGEAQHLRSDNDLPEY
jgi:hypothetical protein